MNKSLNNPEPIPVHNDLPAVWDLVKQDINQRDELGTQKYGTRLQPFNGRDSLKDAYQEALDLVVYLRQTIYEQEISGKDELESRLATLPEEIKNQTTFIDFLYVMLQRFGGEYKIPLREILDHLYLSHRVQYKVAFYVDRITDVAVLKCLGGEEDGR